MKAGLLLVLFAFAVAQVAMAGAAVHPGCVAEEGDVLGEAEDSLGHRRAEAVDPLAGATPGLARSHGAAAPLSPRSFAAAAVHLRL